jgi:hypothetical protein
MREARRNAVLDTSPEPLGRSLLACACIVEVSDDEAV